ncbi:MAG: hypothetical protein F6K35_40080, partial [Okeania sp. SIO2H7]|nr:hypothetical protein [Okeania sp. SIO2H7]
MIAKLKNNSRNSGFFLALCVVGIALFIGTQIMLKPTLAEISIKTSTAPVVVDGRPILKINSTGEYTATLRAELIESKLIDAISSSQLVRVRVREQNQLPTIWVNDSYLLTVTAEDVFPGSSPQEQAEIWAQKIQASLNRALQERSSEFLRKAAIASIGVIIGAIVLQWLIRFLWRRYFHDALKTLLARIPAFSEAVETKSFSLSLNLIPWAIATCLWVATIFYI